MSPQPEIPVVERTSAAPPFNRTDADILLRSTDQVYFRLHKVLLTIASTVFQSMFSLSERANGSSPGDEIIDGLRVVDVEERAEYLDILLRFCYPPAVTETPVLSSLDTIQTVLRLAQKYNMHGVLSLLRTQLVAPKILDEESMRVFAFACHHRMKDEMRIAARYTLRHTPAEPSDDGLRLITGSAYHDLVAYRQTCQAAIAAILSGPNFPWMGQLNPAWKPKLSRFFRVASSCSCSKMDCEVQMRGERTQPAAWWGDVMQAAREILRDQPYGDAVRVPASVIMPSDTRSTIRQCRSCDGKRLGWIDEMFRAMAAQVDEATELVRLSVCLVPPVRY